MDTFKQYFLWLLLLIIFIPAFGCAAKKTISTLSVTSQPGDALCTVHGQIEDSVGKPVRVAGLTPVEFPVEFYGDESLWLKVEKRGYHPFVKKIGLDQAIAIPAVLEKNDTALCNNEDHPAAIKKILLLAPDMEVILRGTIESQSPEAEARKVSGIIGEKIIKRVSTMGSATRLAFDLSQEKAFKAIWRDSRTAMEIMDPIRLNYLMCSPKLETSSGRRSAKEIGETYDADAVLLVSGRVDREQGSLVASKLGLHAFGTAASFASGYGRAMSSNQSTFVYTIYLPAFTNGTSLKAVLVDCRSGEILWVNKGIWGIVEFSDDTLVDKLAEDLLTHLPIK